MDQQSPGEKQSDTKLKEVTTTSAAVSMATSSCTSPTSLSIIQPERQAVQVIQHAFHRPQSMAAQYLHQMYAAQQQHLMLRTAALQQHQYPSHLQSLATIQQASVCQRQSPSSSSNVQHVAGVSQNAVTLPASPVTAQLISRTQTSTAAATTISQQAMLLGNRPANCNQAQMYLRTQMLILAPAATVAAVQSGIPSVTSCCSSSSPSQVQNLALRAHLPGGLSTTHSVVLKPSTQPQTLLPAPSLHKTSVCASKTNHLSDTVTESHPSDGNRLTSGPQIITPAYCPSHTNATIKQQQQQLPSPGQQMAHHHLILQQSTGAGSTHRHLQPLSLTSSIKKPSCSIPGSQPCSCSCSFIRPVCSASVQTTGPPPGLHPQPPPLVAAPQRRSSYPQLLNQPAPPPPPLVLPRGPPNPSASLHRFSLHSVQALAVQSRHGLLTDREMPVVETLVQMPFQDLPPPQTVAVNLKVHPVKAVETPPITKTCKVNGLSSDNNESSHPQSNRSPEPSSGSPKHNGSEMNSSSIKSTYASIESPRVHDSSEVISSNPPPPSPPPPLPAPVLPAVTGGQSHPSSSPTKLPVSPGRSLTPQVLTHLVAGFIIREGLVPFPAEPSLLVNNHQTALPDSLKTQTNEDAAEDSPVHVDQSDSTDSEMDNEDGAEVAEQEESSAEMLQCEYCGNRGPVQKFVRSKRFCSMRCGKRFSVSCAKRVVLQHPVHLAHRPMGRRGRPPSRVNGISREHLQRQARDLLIAKKTAQSLRRDKEEQQQLQHEEEEDEEDEEEEPSVPMRTRQQRQAGGEREGEREQTMMETITVSDGEEDAGSPSQWNVDQVFSYIKTLPGGSDVAAEFRSQDIDGQALLLLTEDHLVSTMNLKLGPALKLCAHINFLKESM